MLQHLKGKRVLAAPFRKTGEIAQNPAVADAKGIVSCEGNVSAPQPAMAPCSGQPCLYFEIEVVQEWAKHVITENGSKTEKGKNTIQTVKSGAIFYVDDGSGPVAIDPREGMDVERSVRSAARARGGRRSSARRSATRSSASSRAACSCSPVWLVDATSSR